MLRTTPAGRGQLATARASPTGMPGGSSIRRRSGRAHRSHRAAPSRPHPAQVGGSSRSSMARIGTSSRPARIARLSSRAMGSDETGDRPPEVERHGRPPRRPRPAHRLRPRHPGPAAAAVRPDRRSCRRAAGDSTSRRTSRPPSASPGATRSTSSTRSTAISDRVPTGCTCTHHRSRWRRCPFTMLSIQSAELAVVPAAHRPSWSSPVP